jgi:ADP-heptose:LPS heptosyltransferase
LELAALLHRATLFVGSDTGPLHLAAAMGTPCVSLHGPTRKEQCGPFGTGHVAIQEVYLRGSSRQRRRADNATMKAISVEKVCGGCDELLSAQAATGVAYERIHGQRRLQPPPETKCCGGWSPSR